MSSSGTCEWYSECGDKWECPRCARNRLALALTDICIDPDCPDKIKGIASWALDERDLESGYRN